MRTLQVNHPLIARLRKVPRRSWILLAASAVAVLALVACLAVFLVFRLWNAGSGWLQGQQHTAVAAAEAKGREQLQALLPKLDPSLERAQNALTTVAPQARQSLEAMAPQMQDAVDRSRDALAIVAPGTADRLQAEVSGVLAPLGAIAGLARAPDVPGEDLDVVPRHPDMSRTGYALADGRRTWNYSGSVGFADALSFHRQPLIDAGFAERISDSSPTAFSGEYRLGQRTLVLGVSAKRPTGSEVKIAER